MGDFFINWEKGAFVGAVAAFTGNVAGGGLIGGAAGGFVGGSGNAAINGASFEQSLTAGGYGAIGGAVGSVVPSFGGTGVVPGAALGAVSGGLAGGITAELTGGSFGSGFRSGALSGAISGGISGGINANNSYYERSILMGNLTKKGFIDMKLDQLNAYNNGLKDVSVVKEHFSKSGRPAHGETRLLLNGVEDPYGYLQGEGTESNLYLSTKGRSKIAIESTLRHEFKHVKDNFTGFRKMTHDVYGAVGSNMISEIRAYNVSKHFGYNVQHYSNQYNRYYNEFKKRFPY